MSLAIDRIQWTMPASARTATSVGGVHVLVGTASVVFAALAFLAWARFAPASLHLATREDGPIESATALAFLAATVAFGAAARRGAGAEAERTPTPAILLVLALAMLACCGEEVSWGQRLLGFQTPAPLRVVNQQGEFNVHNVGRLQSLKYSLLVLTVAAIGLGLPALRWVAPLRRLATAARLPILPARYIALFVAALFFLRHAANWLRLAERNDPQEVGELFFALGMAAFAIHAAARPADVTATPPPEPRSE